MSNENLPLVNWPAEPGEYKVVQFNSDSKPYLRFGREPESKFGDFHEFILERFAQEIGVDCINIPGPDGPVAGLPDNIEYKLIGAGKCNVNLENRTATYHGTSRDYQMGINQDHIQRLRTEFPEWQMD